MIDIHLHIGLLYFGENPLTPEYLLEFMETGGIDRAVLLPIESPECTDYYVTTEYVLEMCAAYPEKFIPFCNVDPRRVRVADVLRDYHARGCKGYGEAMSGLWVDDERLQVVYKTCGELEMPVLFDIDAAMNLDEGHLTRFEQMLQRYPQTTFIGHGPYFWAELSSEWSRGDKAYPSGPVQTGGTVPRLLETYPNLYADLSAGSGHTAMARDPEFTWRFVEQFQDKLLFGTDLCSYGQTIPHMEFWRTARAEGNITQALFDKITVQNTERLLKL